MWSLMMSESVIGAFFLGQQRRGGWEEGSSTYKKVGCIQLEELGRWQMMSIRKKVIWQVANDHIVEEGVEHQELSIQFFDFNLFDEDREVCVGDYVKDFPYFLMLMKLWFGDWQDQISRMNKKVNEDNGRGGTQQNEIFQKLREFSRN